MSVPARGAFISLGTSSQALETAAADTLGVIVRVHSNDTVLPHTIIIDVTTTDIVKSEIQVAPDTGGITRDIWVGGILQNDILGARVGEAVTAAKIVRAYVAQEA